MITLKVLIFLLQFLDPILVFSFLTCQWATYFADSSDHNMCLLTYSSIKMHPGSNEHCWDYLTSQAVFRGGSTHKLIQALLNTNLMSESQFYIRKTIRQGTTIQNFNWHRCIQTEIIIIGLISDINLLPGWNNTFTLQKTRLTWYSVKFVYVCYRCYLVFQDQTLDWDQKNTVIPFSFQKQRSSSV